MEVAAVVEIISSVGLPIALVLVMGWFIYQLWKQSKEREDKLYGELGVCRAVNEKAIETLAIYAERLGNIENDVKDIKETILQKE